MRHKIEIGPEAVYGSVVGAVVDTSGVPFQTIYYESGTYSRAIEKVRSGAPRRGCGAYVGVEGFASSTRVRRGGGTFDFERALVIPPGGGAAVTMMPDWHLLRTIMGDGGAPPSPKDTVKGVSPSAKRIAVNGAAGWAPGDHGAVELDDKIQIFQVTDIDGDDLIIDTALSSVPPAGHTIRRTRYLYYNPGAEGPSVAVKDHGDGTLWIGTGMRLRGFDVRMGADGRVLIMYKGQIGVWSEDHTNSDPDCDPNDCADDVGTPLAFDAVHPVISADYHGTNRAGVVGGLTAAPYNSDRLELDVRDFSMSLEVGSTPRKSLGSRIGVCRIDLGDATLTVQLPMCDALTALDDDEAQIIPRRHGHVPIAPLGENIGGALWLGGLQLAKPAQDRAKGDIVDDQDLEFGVGSYCGTKAIATNGTPARAGYNAAFKIIFVV